MEPRQSGVRFALWSTFRELLGWNDDAGQMPKSFVVIGWVLGAALIVFGVMAATALEFIVLGIVSAVIGIGLVLGTFDLR